MSGTIKEAFFVHIGDTHDRFDALDQIIDECYNMRHLAAWLYPGDLFDARSTIDQRNALAARLLRMGERAPVVIVPGNHDVPGDLDIFRKLHSDFPIYVLDTPGVYRIKTAVEDQTNVAGVVWASIFAVPYPTAAGLLARHVPAADVPTAARAALEAIFIEAAGKLQNFRESGGITLMIGHVNVAGAISSTGQPQIGADIELDAALINRLGVCYKGLNHIHKAQFVGDANYAGSICRLNWGEIEQKSYTVVSYRFDNVTVPDSTQWGFEFERRPVRVPPMWHVEAMLTRDGVTDIEAKDGENGTLVTMPQCGYCGGNGCSTCGESGVDWRGCDVRLRARYRQSEGVVLADAQARAKAMFAAAHRFKFEPVCVPDRAVRAPEVAAAKTLTEKVAAWARVAGTTLPEDVEAKLAALENEDPQVLTTSIESALNYLAFGEEHQEKEATV